MLLRLTTIAQNQNNFAFNALNKIWVQWLLLCVKLVECVVVGGGGCSVLLSFRHPGKVKHVVATEPLIKRSRRVLNTSNCLWGMTPVTTG